MPNVRLPVRKIKEVLRLRGKGLSNRKIARSCSVSRSTVAEYLERATKVARQMVCEFGMSEKLGPLTLGQKQEQVFLGRDFASHPDYSQEIAFEIDKEIRRIVDDAFKKAKTILTERRELLDSIAKHLIERESLEREELEFIFDGKELAPKVKENTSSATPAEEQAPAKGKELEKERVDLPGKLRPAEG